MKSSYKKIKINGNTKKKSTLSIKNGWKMEHLEHTWRKSETIPCLESKTFKTEKKFIKKADKNNVKREKKKKEKGKEKTQRRRAELKMKKIKE
jgi:hypothetical protein